MLVATQEYYNYQYFPKENYQFQEAIWILFYSVKGSRTNYLTIEFAALLIIAIVVFNITVMQITMIVITAIIKFIDNVRQIINVITNTITTKIHIKFSY